jgi:hypothetical protein
LGSAVSRPRIFIAIRSGHCNFVYAYSASCQLESGVSLLTVLASFGVIIPLPQLLYLHRAKITAISPILRWTVALIEANLLAIAVIVAALTMALAVVLEPRQTISRHIAGSDNAENNADFCYPVALHTPIASFKLLPSSAASAELQTKCSGLHSARASAEPCD